LKLDVRRNIENILVFASYLALSKDSIGLFSNVVIESLLGSEDVNWDRKYFNHFIYKKGDQIDSDTLIKIINVFNYDVRLRGGINIVQIIGKLKKRSVDIMNSPAIVKAINLLFEKSMDLTDDSSVWAVINIHEYVDESMKSKISKFIESELDVNFNGEIYYKAVVNDVISHEKYFSEFVHRVPKSKNEVSFKEMITGEADVSNWRLNQLIQVCYKLNLSIPKSIVPPSKYYEWLFNPVDFNYNDFDPLWILEFMVKDYADRFKGINALKKAVEKYLYNNHHKALSKFYFSVIVK
jgi:hypothetical protein